MSTRQDRKQKLTLMKLLLVERAIFLIILAAFGIYFSSQLHQIKTALEDTGIIKNEEGGTLFETVFMNDTRSAKRREPYDTGYAGTVGFIDVARPKNRTMSEVTERLKKLGEDDLDIGLVAQNSYLYPDELLIALANNPEMAKYAAGYLEDKDISETEVSLTKDEKEQRIPLLLQWDPRWGYAEYGSSTIGLSGCGSTALSMVMISLTKNDGLTPDVVAKYSMEKGYYWEGSGTAWALLEDFPAAYGVHVSKPSITESEMRAALDDGRILILAMKEGDFTVNGHFIVVYGYDDNGFLVNDPNCVARSRKKWPFSELQGQIKGMWAYNK